MCSQHVKTPDRQVWHLFLYIILRPTVRGSFSSHINKHMCVCPAPIYCAWVLIKSSGQLMPYHTALSHGSSAAGAPCLASFMFIEPPGKRLVCRTVPAFSFTTQDFPRLKIHSLCNSLYVKDSCSRSSSPTFGSLSECGTRFPSPSLSLLNSCPT